MTTKTDTFMRSAGLIAALTLVSRLLGLVRDCACAAVFGAGVTWDAFAFAFRVPNLFRRLFGEGALSAAFVPAFTEYLELRGTEEASRLAGRVAGALAAALVMLLVAGEVLVLGLLWGLTLSLRWRLALALTAVMLPYMVLVCLAALAGAALQAMRHFAAPAAAPILLNLVWIAAVAAAAPAVSSDARGRIFVVAAGILVAGVLQLALQLAVLQRKGFRWHLSLHVLHPEVRRVAGAMIPVALGMAAFQVNVLLDSLIAIALAGPEEGAAFHVMGRTVAYPMQAGANSVLYYASRLMQMPLGVFGIAVATAVFPALSSHAARRDWEAFSDAVARSVGSMIFIG